MSAVSRAHHSHHSMLREKILESIFIGEVLQWLWRREIYDVEVLRSEFDAGGYDILIERGALSRHVQLKSSVGKTSRVKASVKLYGKPSGCVIWMVVNDDLEIQKYRFFGSAAGQPIRSMEGFAVATHTKRNKQGEQSERPEHRVIPVAEFEEFHTLDDLLLRLLGSI